MTAAEVKDALRRRHAALVEGAAGPWTCIEEWRGIDLLAIAAWGSAQPAIGVRYPIVGYEVKVSRSDYRRELLRPAKRAGAVERCHSFYFAVPDGLLYSGEIAYEEPDWVTPSTFVREPCPARCYRGRRNLEPCSTCEGRGYAALSRAEAEIPFKLWVPRDVGLLVVTKHGTRIVRRAPLNRNPKPLADGAMLGQLVRWVSMRPDPRHAAPAPAPALEEAVAS